MSKRAIPFWPYRMKSGLACKYLDISQSKFLIGVRTGKYPQPVRDGGNSLWHREDLDHAADRLKGI